MKTRTILRDRGWNKIEPELNELIKSYAGIGFFSESKDKDGNFMATIAMANDLGVPGRIPPRPFVRGWVDANKKKIQNEMEELYKKVADKKISADKAIKLLAEYAIAGIKKYMIDLKNPENSRATRRRKKGANNPLIDQGRMVGEVKSKIFKGKKPKGQVITR